jgi:hypothetical protein
MRYWSVSGACHGVGDVRHALVLASVALTLGGCITTQSSSSYQSQVGVPPPHPQMAVAGPPKSAIEGDGLPRQLAPRIRPYVEKDDPSEPFSPNYGPPPIESEKPSEDPKPPVHQVRMSAAEARRIIAAAIVAHEKRRP